MKSQSLRRRHCLALLVAAALQGCSDDGTSGDRNVAVRTRRASTDQGTVELPNRAGRVRNANADAAIPSGPAPDATEPILAATPDFLLTAGELAEAYEHDEEATDSRYLGALIELRGVVYSIAPNSEEQPCILVSETADPTSDFIMCITVNKQPWLDVCRGQAVTIRGVYANDIMFQCDLRDCVVVKKGESPAITLSAEELAAEFIADQEALSDRYLNKQIIVESEVLRFEPAKADPDSVFLRGTADTPIRCSLSGSFGREQLARLTVGKIARLRGTFTAFQDDANPRLFDCFVLDRPTRNNLPQTDVPPAEPIRRMSATELYKKYNNDLRGATKKFAGTIWEVSGVVSSMGNMIDGTSYVSLETVEYDAFGVLCITVDERPWARLCPGQQVTLRGKWPDNPYVPTLTETTIVSAGPSPAKRITAEQLTAEYAQDPETASEKYEGYHRIVGKLLDKQRDEIGTASLLLDGGQNARIKCGFLVHNAEQVQPLKIGDQVELLGEVNCWRDGSGINVFFCLIIRHGEKQPQEVGPTSNTQSRADKQQCALAPIEQRGGWQGTTGGEA